MPAISLSAHGASAFGLARKLATIVGLPAAACSTDDRLTGPGSNPVNQHQQTWRYTIKTSSGPKIQKSHPRTPNSLNHQSHSFIILHSTISYSVRGGLPQSHSAVFIRHHSPSLNHQPSHSEQSTQQHLIRRIQERLIGFRGLRFGACKRVSASLSKFTSIGRPSRYEDGRFITCADRVALLHEGAFTRFRRLGRGLKALRRPGDHRFHRVAQRRKSD